MSTEPIPKTFIVDEVQRANATTSTEAITPKTTDNPETSFISNMGDLKKNHPDIWDKTLKSLANSMLSSMRKSQERVSNAIRKARYNG